MSAIIVVAATAASYAAGWIIGNPFVLPVLNTIASYPLMIGALRRGDLRAAVARMLVWAAALAVCATLLSYARPARTDTLFLRGAAYRAEMFAWVRTGVGAESTPSIFIPQQAMHAAAFAVLALATAGSAAMVMGAVLMNYMGHYVGTLAAASAHPALTVILGWHPWSIVRIVSFVVIGVVLSAPLVGAATGARVNAQLGRTLLAWSACGLVVDVAMKTLLAPAWHRLLLRVVGW